MRTIQRIEAGEVLPRTITVKILLQALGESYESFSTNQNQLMNNQGYAVPTRNRNTVLMAVLAGAVYLVAEIILGTMDIARFTDGREWGFRMNAIYAGLTIVMVISFVLFARGFIVLGMVFENSLLKVATYLLMAATLVKGIVDANSLWAEDVESIWIPYVAVAIVLGALGVVFGLALLRLQDSMGELSRIAGILEIVMGCLLITVVLFFVAYLILVPAVVIEILVLYRGYEYLSRSESAQVGVA